ncbi:MAG: porin [Geminicoccaceae bacterium]|nr:porin [Geminicoccaceae bacterium]
MISSAQAGDLEVGVSGFMRTLAAFGDLDNESGNNDSRSFYFRNDSEVHVNARATDDETGLSYGATIEFETDTNRNDNTDETWIFISGGFGELRFGDEDGASDNMKIGGFSAAAGTGGIDGAGEVASVDFGLTNSSDATKVIYYSPVVSGFQLGVSFTPDTGHAGAQENPADNNGNLEDMVEAGATYAGSFGGLDVKAAVVGYTADGEDGSPVGDANGIGGGASVGFAGFTFAGGYYADENQDNINAGVKGSFGPANVSVNYAYSDIDGGGEPENIVLSADVGILPGVTLAGDVSFFDRDDGGDDDGVTGVARLGVAF